jgi:hypothetical protein
MKKLDPNKPFLVKESMGVNIFLGLVFLAMFISSFFNNDPDAKGFEFKILYIAIIPAVLFIRKGLINRVCMVINKKGIYHSGELITTWDDFIDARIDQDEVIMTIQDNFVLFVRYRQPGNKIFRSKIPLRNTQNKAEEEIIEAIRFFSTLHKRRI